MSELSIHDNNVYAYNVLCERRRIVLYTEYRDNGPEEYTDVVFSGVLAHHFQNVLPGNILFGIEEVEPARIVQTWAELFALQKNYGWPAIKYSDPDELISILKQRECKGFEIAASHGLDGWVLAAKMELQVRTGRFAQ